MENAAIKNRVYNWEEAAYLNLMTEIMSFGIKQKNRTGIDTYMIPGAMLQFNLEKTFPLLTTKKMATQAIVGELLGFLRGYTSAAQYRDLGCNIWNANANLNKDWLNNPNRKGTDDLGYIYSRLWRDMPNGANKEVWDQIQKLIEGIKKDPTSRRLIVSAWHPEVFDQAALPPCHVLFQVIIDQTRGVMNLCMYQRSCDYFLGVPFNIASYSLLLNLLATVTGYKPGVFTWFGADVHIYEDHLQACEEQLARSCFAFPTLKLEGVTKDTLLEKIEPSQIIFENYESHPAIRASMAV